LATVLTVFPSRYPNSLTTSPLGRGSYRRLRPKLIKTSGRII
jgi:hypothetical protein